MPNFLPKACTTNFVTSGFNSGFSELGSLFFLTSWHHYVNLCCTPNLLQRRLCTRFGINACKRTAYWPIHFLENLIIIPRISLSENHNVYLLLPSDSFKFYYCAFVHICVCVYTVCPHLWFHWVLNFPFSPLKRTMGHICSVKSMTLLMHTVYEIDEVISPSVVWVKLPPSSLLKSPSYILCAIA